MKRTTPRGGGYRQLVAAERQHRLDQWNGRLAAGEAPGWSSRTEPMRDTLLEALQAGEPVQVDSATLLIALMHAKLDHRRFAFRGVDADKVFLLDEHDRLTEL